MLAAQRLDDNPCRPRHFKPVLPGVIEPSTGLSMGQSTELMAKTWHISRAAQDELALESHRHAADAWNEGFFEDLVIEYQGLKRDNNIRPDTSLEKLAKLNPTFDLSGAGTLTAGNSTPLTDGAAAVLLASEEWAAAGSITASPSRRRRRSIYKGRMALMR